MSETDMENDYHTTEIRTYEPYKLGKRLTNRVKIECDDFETYQKIVSAVSIILKK